MDENLIYDILKNNNFRNVILYNPILAHYLSNKHKDKTNEEYTLFATDLRNKFITTISKLYLKQKIIIKDYKKIKIKKIKYDKRTSRPYTLV